MCEGGRACNLAQRRQKELSLPGAQGRVESSQGEAGA